MPEKPVRAAGTRQGGKGTSVASCPSATSTAWSGGRLGRLTGEHRRPLPNERISRNYLKGSRCLLLGGGRYLLILFVIGTQLATVAHYNPCAALVSTLVGFDVQHSRPWRAGSRIPPFCFLDPRPTTMWYRLRLMQFLYGVFRQR